MADLCAPCQHAWSAWLGYRIVEPPVLVQIGRPSVRHVAEADERRWRRWRDTVRTQQDIITQICTARHGGDHG